MKHDIDSDRAVSALEFNLGIIADDDYYRVKERIRMRQEREHHDDDGYEAAAA